jgi:hypothetical protein
MRNAIVLCCSIALLGAAGAANAQDWTKSKWGPNDEIGAANYMTPELVVKAASLVKTGKTYALGIPVDTKTPAYPPPHLQDHHRAAGTGRQPWHRPEQGDL